MPLPSSGTLTMAQINAEFGRGNDLNSYRGTQWYTAAGGSGTFPAGAISFSDFYGKQLASPTFSFTISSHIDRANLRSLAVAAGWNQSSAVIATLASGYYIYSTVDGSAALTIDGSFPSGVTFINNGYVMGKGGHGGGYYYNSVSSVVIQNWELSAASNAINLGVSCTIQNNSYIAGGGGGGGCTGSTSTGGGGAGGGTGGSFYYNNAGAVSQAIGGAGGSIGSSGANGGNLSGTVSGYSGGGGGRILPGSNVTCTVTVAGSPVGSATSTGGGESNTGSASIVTGSGTTGAVSVLTGAGGSGGGTGCVYASIGTYANYSYAGGGGSGWGASGGSSATAAGSAAGSAGGKCVELNGYSVTWAANGTRYGAIS